MVTGVTGNICARAKEEKQRCIPRKPRETEVWVSGAEIQTLAVDTRTAVWVSTTEKIILRETRKFSQRFRVVSAPALHKNQAVILFGWVAFGVGVPFMNLEK